MRKMVKLLGLVMVLFLFSRSPLLAQVNYCEGNFDYDKDQDGGDAFIFKTDFGRSQFSNPCPPDGPAPVPKTGQTLCYDNLGVSIDCTGTGQDGEYKKGVIWPNPRFTDNANGTITDNVTGLIWLKNANCFGIRIWSQALFDCNGLNSGECGLTDGSSAGDWRLPNLFELESLRDMKYYNPTLSNTIGNGQWTEGDPFANVQNNFYWSSTTLPLNPIYALGVFMTVGTVTGYDKSTSSNELYAYHVWPVRGGH